MRMLAIADVRRLDKAVRDGGDIRDGVEDRESTGGDTERAEDRERIGGEIERTERVEAGDFGGRPRRDGEGMCSASRARREELVFVSEGLRTGVRLLPLCVCTCGVMVCGGGLLFACMVVHVW